ncbi:protein-tyrosine phosphatase [Goodfellowiella coeruleoviolacea]|uniref:protein-tyrosine-phosphatase n=2 Tax=Goodfellowiella coeruleoviolacea TaxID=334858 RepID=A0AAE3GHB0_9PSEU|nr:protein-tyrosine phosphatase [Goodfellowiella coeruleoviolacea]
MAALICADHLRRAGLADRVRVSSAGIGPWHVGEPIDPRAGKLLADHGYPTGHVAAQVNDEHLAADLLVAMDTGHARALVRLLDEAGTGGADRVRMLRSFEPNPDRLGDVDHGDWDVPDPYYDGRAGFVAVFDMIEAAMPGLLDWVRQR